MEELSAKQLAMIELIKEKDYETLLILTRKEVASRQAEQDGRGFDITEIMKNIASNPVVVAMANSVKGMLDGENEST